MTLDFAKIAEGGKELTILEAALQYRDWGFSVIPVQKNKKPYIKWEPYQKEKASPEQIKQWWQKWPNANVALITGAISADLVVADADSAAGLDKLNELIPEGLQFPMAATPGNGYHLFFVSKNGLSNAAGFLKDCDFRAEGGYAILPPSKGLNNKSYRWIPGHALLNDLIPPALPEAIQKALSNTETSAESKKPSEWQNELAKGVKDGNRHGAMSQLIGRYITKGLTDEEILPLIEAIDAKNNPPLAQEESLLKFIQGVRKTDARKHTETQDVAAQVREYLLDEFDGGVFKISDLRRELGLNDNQYTVARNCVKRMVDQGQVQKHGYQLGTYRVVNTKKNQIEWSGTEAQASSLILPGNLHQVVTIRDGDMIAVAGFRNHNKTGIAIEAVRLNLDNFKVHFFITEYQARMKQRLLDFGIDLNHPNFHSYRIEKSDYIPDKIESGPGVLNVIDHFPNLDNFYLIGKYQDEIHRALDGALCLITHQKKDENGVDALGGSFWRITPTLAVSLFWNDANEYQGKMRIVKAKEPGGGRNNANNLTMEYKLAGGHDFEWKDWKR